MASVFLSYAREDFARASKIASALENTGHDVWWDQQLRGGTRFASEIDAALKRADFVIVLWSAASVKSPWVQDEAAAGRDQGQLIPVLIERVEPPLGFRQFHTIDLSSWRGGRKTVLSALEAALAANDDAQAARASGVADRTSRRKVWPIAAAAALAILAGLVALIFVRDQAVAQSPVVAVLPFASVSSDETHTALAEGMAEAVLSQLGREPGLKVISRTSSWQFGDGKSDLQTIRRALGVSHVVEGSTRTAGKLLRVNVRLVTAKDGTQIWSEEYERPVDDVFAVQDEIGKAVAKRLGVSLARRAPARVQTPQTAADVYALYLAGRAKMRDRSLSGLREAVEIAQRVIRADPDYAPGHALYAEAIWLLSDAHYGFGDIPTDRAEKLARAHAQQAIRLAPQLADGYAALGHMLISDPAKAARAFEKAITLDPSRAELRNWLSIQLEELGKSDQARKQVRMAAEIDPLSPPINARYVQFLDAQRRFAEAEVFIRQFEERGGSPGWAALMRSDLAFYQADLSEALKHQQLATKLAPDVMPDGLPWIEYYLGFKDQALERAAKLHPSIRLYMEGDHEGAARQARRMGPDLWQPGFGANLFAAMAEARQFNAIAQIYTRDAEKRVCAYWGISPALTFVRPLRLANRHGEANGLLNCLERRLKLHFRGPVRTPRYRDSYLWAARAQVEALHGDGNAALAAMRRAIELGFRTPFGQGLRPFPELDDLRGHEDYRRLDAQLKQLVAREREEALQFSS